MEHWTEYSRFFTELIVILDPFMAIPIMLALTENRSAEERHEVVNNTTLTVGIVLIVVALMGESLLTWLGTSLGSFRVGGGIVLLLMALAMLQAKVDTVRATTKETHPSSPHSSIAIVPLAIPLLAGPGAMSTVIIAMHRSSQPYHVYGILGVIVIVVVVLWLVLRLAQPIGRFLGEIGLNILNRIFGLILTAIAIEIMANGLKQIFPALN